MFVVCVVRGLQHDERGHWGEGYRGMYMTGRIQKSDIDDFCVKSLLCTGTATCSILVK